MSYILDALQKSETERQSQIAPETYRLSRPVETDPSSAMRWLLLLCLLTLTVAGLSLLWQMWSPRNAATEANNVTHESTAPQTAPQTAPAKALEKAAEKVPESMSVASIATATKTMQADTASKSLAPAQSTDTESDLVSSPAASPQPASTEAAPQPVLEPAVAVPSKSEPRQTAAMAKHSVVPLPETLSETPSEKRTTQAKMPVAKQAESTLADAQPPQQTQVVTMAELPAGIRSSMPSLSFSFHVYASDPARRTIIINGRRLREGQSLNKEIRLINITPEGVVVAYRQHHIALPVINQW